MKKILIIEDEPALLNALKDKMEASGYLVLRAKDGEQGLEMALSDHPDLIILDIIMPRMDGFIMLEKLRADAWGKEAKIIILSNLNDKDYVMKSFRNEVYDYYVKTDIRIDDLISKVREKLV
jgi:DNA-binding response OmpR family regulator